MRILILGGDGMLGHRLLGSLADGHEVRVTLRQPLDAYRGFGLFSTRNAIPSIDVRDSSRLVEVVASFAPDVVVNCVGIVKQRREAKSPIPSLEINSLLPHKLLELGAANGARLIHFSTDCVFSGRAGGYRETDEPDPVDLYGRTKLLGEVDNAPGLTLRTSIIGLELSRKAGLVEWFLAQRGTVRGYRRAIYTGLTTSEMGRLVRRLIERHPQLHGVWHVASTPITKYDLLVDLARRLSRSDIDIVADDDFMCDRSLRADRFLEATGYTPTSWPEMLTELADDVRRRP
ncbi:MAG TPA: SDR family oxidoreductase [Vicinamibacterales bacterium]|nr:SDR family oxidoreductase [Vicinamibacterales bacterium]